MAVHYWAILAAASSSAHVYSTACDTAMRRWIVQCCQQRYTMLYSLMMSLPSGWDHCKLAGCRLCSFFGHSSVCPSVFVVVWSYHLFSSCVRISCSAQSCLWIHPFSVTWPDQIMMTLTYNNKKSFLNHIGCGSLCSAVLHFRSLHADTSLQYKTTGLVHHVVCLFTSQPKLLLIYWPRRDRRLSWPIWLVLYPPSQY